jgi:hypothetical protein
MAQDTPQELIKDIEDNYFNGKLAASKKKILDNELDKLGNKENH